ncbi:MAG: phosphoribosylamine--glycine ligase [Minisyncoccota bacterium]
MDVLLIGSGGREHALAWKLKQSPKLGKLFIAPGNAGTRELGENVALAATDIPALIQFAEKNAIGLTIVGPDDPLALGIVDEFRRRNLRIFGPTKASAQIESSKAYAKALMKEANIPTADFETFTDHEAALAYVRRKGAPIVVKASGLALGKGVSVCATLEEAEEALDEIMVQHIHKEAGNEVVIEEFLVGQEISIHVLCDGIDFKMFPAAQDHKRALDDDQGKNTGGMGTIAPVPWVTPEMMYTIERVIVRPTLEALSFKSGPFSGMLFPGIIMTMNGPKVLEFNARFGDPETQVYMRLMKNDLLDVLNAVVDKTLGQINMEWLPMHAANIVLASGGYPDAYEKGFEITGLEEAGKMEEIVVFHAGTTREGGIVKTAGGRVLGVSSLGSPLKSALTRAYTAADKIQFQGKHMRRDIGAKSI